MQKTLNATLQEVSGFSSQLEQYLAVLTVNERTTIVLAIQELLVNIVKHAYAGTVGQIDFEMSLSDAEIIISVRDYSKSEFSLPDNIQTPDPLTLPESGMGLFIIQQSFDVVTYKHNAGVNDWHLVKKIEV